MSSKDLAIPNKQISNCCLKRYKQTSMHPKHVFSKFFVKTQYHRPWMFLIILIAFILVSFFVGMIGIYNTYKIQQFDLQHLQNIFEIKPSNINTMHSQNNKPDTKITKQKQKQKIGSKKLKSNKNQNLNINNLTFNELNQQLLCPANTDFSLRLLNEFYHRQFKQKCNHPNTKYVVTFQNKTQNNSPSKQPKQINAQIRN